MSMVKPQGEFREQDVYGDFAVTPVPMDKRRSFWSAFLVFTGVVICAPALWSGAAIASGLNFLQSTIAVLIGFGITGIIGGFVAMIGSCHGVSTIMLSRHIFGRYGAMIMAVVLAFTMLGWYSFQAGFFGLILNTMFPGYTLTHPQVAAVWGGLLMMITAIFGYKGLAFLSFFSIPLLLMLIGAGDIALLSGVGFSAVVKAVPMGSFSLAEGITMMAGGMAAGAAASADVARYNKTLLHAFLGFFLALAVVTPVIVLSGAALTLGTGSPDLPSALVGVGLGAAALVILILSQWTSNDNNLYSSSLAVLNLVRIKKWIVALILGTLATIVAGLGILDYFMGYMIFLGTYIPPIAGIFIADYFIVKPYIEGRREGKRYDFGPGTNYAVIDILAFVMIFLSGYVGGKIPGITVINAILLALIGYSVLTFIFRKIGIPYRFGKRTEDESGF
ncbi:MAG: cytosine permease [Bacillota bacterium]